MPIERSGHAWTTTAPLFVGFVLLAGLIAATFWFGAAVQRENEAIRQTVEVKNRLFRLLASIQDAETGQRGYLLTGDQDYLRPYQQAVARIDTELDALEVGISDNAGQIESSKKLRSITDQKLAELKTSIDDHRADKHDKGLDIVRAGIGKDLMDRARDTIDLMRGNEDRLLADRQDRVARAKTELQIGTTLAGSLLVILAAFAILSSRRQTRRLAASRDGLQDANERLVEAHRQAVAAERFAAIGRLSADIAHEIRNPIAAMRLKAENALASKDRERAAMALGVVLGQIERVDHLLRDLLNFSQARTLVRAPTDLRSLLAASVQLHEDLAARRGLRVVAQTEGLPTSDCPHLDREQVLRALDNLLLNALQHAPPGSLVTLAAMRSVREGVVRLQLRVSDAGPGIDPTIRARLFEPFVTGRSDGTGLGLAIVKKIALAHRGDVTLAEGNPTTFVLDLPWQPS